MSIAQRGPMTNSPRFDLVPLAEISKRLGVPRDKLEASLGTHAVLRFVPRSFNAKGKLIIYRVDFELAIVQCAKRREKQIELFDAMFADTTLDLTLGIG